MLVKVQCEYCGNENLIMSDIIHGFYCNQCDEDLTMAEVDIEELKEDGTDEVNVCCGCIHMNLMDGSCNEICKRVKEEV